MTRKHSVAGNIAISISVQIVSLLVSFVMNLIVPKVISEYQYAYWQSYVLYVGYVGVLHFGLLDGLVLRYSQYDYDQLDKARVRSQFQLLLIATGGMSVAAAGVSLLFLSGVSRATVLLVAVGIVTKNLVTYNSYSFQITNRIDKYAILIIVQRLGYGALACVLLLLRVDRFEWYCAADLFGDLLGIALAQVFNKGMYFGKSLPLREALSECKVNVSAGIILMLANWSSMLLVGGSKMIVQWRWDELVFGKVSFAFSLSNLFLTFVSAISVVLFPQLKRMEQDKLPQVYRSIRGAISPMLFAMLVLYFPGCVILERYLPKYAQSLTYLGTLLPIVIYTSKVSLLTNNYLKAYRCEKDMLWVNALSVAIAFVLYGAAAYLLGDLTAVLVCVVLANMLKSILSEAVVMRIIHISFKRDLIVEAVMTAVFMMSVALLDRWVAFAVYAVALAAYFVYYRHDIGALAGQMSQKIHRKRA